MKKIQLKKQSRKPAADKNGSWIKDTLVVVLGAVVLALLIKSFLFDSRVIPSTSMYPTIEIGDRVIVSKLSYLGSNVPERGDVIVFEPPEFLNEQYDLIKRVIGLPGDTVQISSGTVYVNGEALLEDYLYESPQYEYGPVTVPDGCYFVLGDNRNNSLDGHLWPYPFLDQELIVGKAVFCYWPILRMGVL